MQGFIVWFIGTRFSFVEDMNFLGFLLIGRCFIELICVRDFNLYPLLGQSQIYIIRECY